MQYAVPSARAQIIEARTYLRPTNEEGTEFETPEDAVQRIIQHQAWLWERARGLPLGQAEWEELNELAHLLNDRRICTSGRTRWLGGTPISRAIESTMFNCAYTDVKTVHDVVDVLWLLLQGCGVGFRPVVGVLNGFANRMKVEVIRSNRGPYERGAEENVESFENGVWTIRVGDSSQAWAKSAGKLLAGKAHAQVLRLDFSEVRGPGGRLRSYGWISSGDHQIARAYEAIAEIMNNRAGALLTRIDILDIVNWLGTILSSRRSAEIALFAYDEPEADEFAVAKQCHTEWNKAAKAHKEKTGEDYMEPFPQAQRSMSNNSLVFSKKPTKYEMKRLFRKMAEAGGSEPGFINAEAARKRAPWFRGVNPCGEILLGDKGFCNLCETVLHRFNGDEDGLHRAHYLVARANYRQTCVNLRDGILQESWHQLNEFLRLCGVGVTGAVAWEHVKNEKAWADLKVTAIAGADSMADQLGLPRSKCVTTIKPSGTQSKASGIVGVECPEGIHKPLGRYIFNNVRFASHDPIMQKLDAAGYYSRPDTIDAFARIVRLPVEYSNVEFDKQDIDIADGGQYVTRYVNNESAVSQLERYKLVMDNYVDHNCSVTISYDPSEVPDIIDWLMENWDSYVGVSFVYRTDPDKSAEDLGYTYLPQEVVDEYTFKEYVAGLKPVNLFDMASSEVIESEMECAGGACPMR